VAPPQRGHLRQPAAADLTVHHAYFEPTVGILLNWIKGWNFSQCRQDCPLPRSINRGGFDGLKEEKIGSKLSQKISLPPSPRCGFSSSVSYSFFLRHRKPTPTPFLPPAPPWATSTTKRCQEHRPTTTVSVISHRERLSLLCKTFLLPSLSTVAFGHHHSYPEHQLHHRKPARPPTDHQAATAALSLLLPAFLSPLQCFLLLLTADSGHRHLSRSLLSHWPDILSTLETPKPWNFLLPALPPSSLSRLLHAEFISACSGRIINLPLGLANFGPAQMVGLDPARPPFKKKYSKNFKNHFKKNVIFSNIFLPILHNIRLYIYTVKYKSGIKIPGFLRNISKKKSKHFQKNLKNL